MGAPRGARRRRTDRRALSTRGWDDAGKPAIAWDDKTARDGLVDDALTVVAGFDGSDLDQRAAKAFALLALVAGQDVEPAATALSMNDGGLVRYLADNVAQDRLHRSGHRH